MPLVTDLDVLIGTKGEVLLADQGLKKFNEPIQPAFFAIWALADKTKLLPTEVKIQLLFHKEQAS